MTAIRVRGGPFQTPADVGKHLVVAAVEQITETSGEEAGHEAAAGALAAAVAVLVVALDEAAARRIVEHAIQSGLECVRAEAAQGVH